MRSEIVPALVRELTPYGLLRGGSTLLLGVSGGADSVALLVAMKMLAPSHDFSLAAVHVEHGLRGKASQADAAYVLELCSSLQVPLKMYTVDARAKMAEDGCGAEEAARILRYGCFESAMKELDAAALLTAHHGDDQAETVLMHLLRGTGPSGLTGMAKVKPFAGGHLLRPLLSFSHADLCNALLEEGIPWREDETNAEPLGLRNQLRLSVLPVLERLAPGCIGAIGRAALLSQGEEEWWHKETDSFLAKYVRVEREVAFLQRAPLNNMDRAYTLRILRAFYGAAVQKMGILVDKGMVSLDYQKTVELADCLYGTGDAVVNLPCSIRAERSSTKLYLMPPKSSAYALQVPFSLSGFTTIPNAALYAKPWVKGMPMGDGVLCQALDKKALANAVVRYRQAGDLFPLLNGQGTQKLKDTLSARHVDRPLRDCMPILASGKTVLWIPGLGASGYGAVTDSTIEGVFITYTGLLPWEVQSTDQSK